jgi:hypothetical protein
VWDLSQFSLQLWQSSPIDAYLLSLRPSKQVYWTYLPGFPDIVRSWWWPCCLAALLNIADKTNQNLTAAQKELLLWHQKWAHANNQCCQVILSEPQEDGVKQIIKPRNKQALSCRQPICAACQMGK